MARSFTPPAAHAALRDLTHTASRAVSFGAPYRSQTITTELAPMSIMTSRSRAIRPADCSSVGLAGNPSIGINSGSCTSPLSTNMTHSCLTFARPMSNLTRSSMSLSVARGTSCASSNGKEFMSTTLPPLRAASTQVTGSGDCRDIPVTVEDERATNDGPTGDQNRPMSRTALAILNQPSLDTPAHERGASGFALVDPALPHVSVLDLAATRGDGIFESLSVTAGMAHAVDAHLRRFSASARKLELPSPDLEAWRAAIDAVVNDLDPVAEAVVKIVMTRGIEGDPKPTGWVYASPSPDHRAARETGIRVITLDRGYRHDIELSAPWLLTGAKTLSYAINRAVLREAARRSADDVIFVSSDGYVLEGPTSSVLIRRGNAILTPGTGLGILEGTTQGDLFDWAISRGLETGFELLTPARLAESDAVWLVSSGRQAAPVREIDGVPHTIDHELSASMNAYLLGRTR